MMVTLTEIILKDPARYEYMRAGNTTPFWVSPAMKTELRLLGPTGNVIPCQHHHRGWFNFLLPAETPHVFLNMTATTLLDQTIRDVILFMGAQEWSLPVPSALTRSPRQSNQARTAWVGLPPMPRWVRGLFCVHLEPVVLERDRLNAA
ncbi:hypothetical protein [Bombella apis]|uniref:hypothetical protein n=1 Tax=Bombella apis TaxID=1785988 RepID=UPI0024A8760F|nr:hypothetical protein [Bombella apis]